MNENTIRINRRMQTIIRDNKNGNCTLAILVNGLEGSFTAREEKMPNEFITKWFIHWRGLEQIFAAGSEQAIKTEIKEDIRGLEDLLPNIESLRT